MDEQDKEAFEKWLNQWSYPLYGKSPKEFHPDHIVWMEKAFNDVLSYERERSKKLIEALENLQSWTEDENFKFGNAMLRNLAIEALKEYRGEK